MEIKYNLYGDYETSDITFIIAYSNIDDYEHIINTFSRTKFEIDSMIFKMEI